MNYQEYEDFFGTPPKMPEAPKPKYLMIKPRPIQDPEEIPFLTL